MRYAQFKPLWIYLKVLSHGDLQSVSLPTSGSQQWRQMFESFDYNQDGIIDAAELASALNHYEFAYFI